MKKISLITMILFTYVIVFSSLGKRSIFHVIISKVSTDPRKFSVESSGKSVFFEHCIINKEAIISNIFFVIFNIYILLF